MSLSLSWNETDTPVELHDLLATLAVEYPIYQGEGGEVKVSFEKASATDILAIDREGCNATIRYGKIHHAARGIGTLLAGLPNCGESMTEKIPFTSYGIMLDCSRNAVMKVEYFKKWLRRLSLMGYNMAMLYTEDTYELPGEDYFGYNRGRYTKAELKEIDKYAAALGIEMIGCIQTLGHLAQVLKWPAYREITDTSSVLLVEEESTYELIGKMLDTFAECFSSRRIHIGMDEAHDLGRGRYMDWKGYRRGFDLFNQHLAKVTEACSERNLFPMIWSDMYFRMGSKNRDYYDMDSAIPDEVASEIPVDARLVYWDYYHKDADFYREWIRRHRALGFEPIMASGVWTWTKLWYDHRQTVDTVGPCLEACRSENLKEVFFTLWGDDGGYCEFDSSLAGLCYAAECGFNEGEPDDAVLEKRFKAVCGDSYRTTLLPAAAFNHNLPASALLWDDPLLGIFYNNTVASEDGPNQYKITAEKLEKLSKDLEPVIYDQNAADMQHAGILAVTLKNKVNLRHKLVQAYKSRDEKRLREVQEEAEEVIGGFEKLMASFRRQWYKRNKPQGFEVIQIRLAGQVARHREVQQRIGELLTGDIDAIPELDECPEPAEVNRTRYSRLATASLGV